LREIDLNSLPYVPLPRALLRWGTQSGRAQPQMQEQHWGGGGGQKTSSQSPRREVEILGTGRGRIPRQIKHFTDSFHSKIQAIEAMREWAEIELPA
jgi:hypothetical protein